MSLVESLVAATETDPKTLPVAAARLLLSQYDRDVVRKGYAKIESDIRANFGVLLQDKEVVRSSIYRAQRGAHIWQVDLYSSMELGKQSDDASKSGEALHCYPFKLYDAAENIEGKLEQLRARYIEPVTDRDTRPSILVVEGTRLPSHAVVEDKYGFVLTTDDAVTVADSGLFKLFGKANDHTFAISRSYSPFGVEAPGVIDEAIQTEQVLFKQFLGELLEREGYVQSTVPVWQKSTAQELINE